MNAANDGLGELHDELYAAADVAVRLLGRHSRHPGDEYDLAAMRLGNAADQIPVNPKSKAALAKARGEQQS